LKNASYKASSIKRKRATKAEMAERFDELFAIISDQYPMTVRQVFYQATVRGIVEKTEAGCTKVGNALIAMRRSGRLPYTWITDSTRWQRKPLSFSDPAHAIEFTARMYRKALWDDTPTYVEIWIEKDALAGVVLGVTSEYDVPLMSARGYPSLSFLYGAAEAMAEQDRPCFVYQLGDWDPSGVDASRSIRDFFRANSPGRPIAFQRIGVTPEQIDELNLPSRPTKETDTRTKKWTGGDSVELDALPADYLRALVREAIERHMPRRQFDILKVAEKSERQLLTAWATEARH
jgi:hypothetical protein